MVSTLRVLDIIEGTSVDGPGLRTSIYFAGCQHHCHGCHNPQSWDENGGKEMSIPEIMEIIIENDFNVTFSGGDPLFQIDNLTTLAREIKKTGKTIWCYTGYRYEEIFNRQKFNKLLEIIDVLVDGRFENNLKDTSLRFRGSSNQRLIDVKKSTPDNIIEWSSDL